MTQVLEIIRGGDQLTVAQAREALQLLLPIVEAAPLDEEAREVTSSVISRMPRDELASVLLDWWFVITTGGSPPLGWAYNLPDSVPEPLRSAMSTTVEISHTGLDAVECRAVV